MTASYEAYSALETWLYGLRGEPSQSACFWIAQLAISRQFREEVKSHVKPGQERITKFVNELALIQEEGQAYLSQMFVFRDAIGEALDMAGIVIA